MQELQKQIDELQIAFNSLTASSTIPYEIEVAFRQRLSNLSLNVPTGFSNVPMPAITAPSGGATVDSQARTTLGTVLTTLQTLGLTK